MSAKLSLTRLGSVARKINGVWACMFEYSFLNETRQGQLEVTVSAIHREHQLSQAATNAAILKFPELQHKDVLVFGC